MEDTYPANFRECSIVGGKFSVILRTTYKDENLDYLISQAMNLLIIYEDDNLRDNVKDDLKEWIKKEREENKKVKEVDK